MLFTKSQRQEIEKGKVFGLLKEEIKVYAKPYFNAKQMQELRLGLEQGQGIRTVKTYAHFYVSYAEMARRRQRYNDKEERDTVFEDKKKDKKLIVLTCITIFLFAFSLLLFFSSFLESDPFIILSKEMISLKSGEKADLSSYIQELDSNAVITNDMSYQQRLPGTYLFSYHVQKDDQEIIKTLRIQVTDNQPPEIILTDEKIVIEDIATFHCKDYVDSVKDNISNEKLTVGCSDFLDATLEEQDVLYSATDSNGNTGYAVLTVIIKQSYS